MIKISFTFDSDAGVNAIDPVGDLLISDGRSLVLLKTTYLDSWLEAMISAQSQAKVAKHLRVGVPEEPEPVLIDRLPDGQLKITYRGKTVVADAPEALEAALRTASRSFLEAIRESPERERNKIIDSIRRFASESTVEGAD
jgi:hypothetical protein